MLDQIIPIQSQIMREDVLSCNVVYNPTIAVLSINSPLKWYLRKKNIKWIEMLIL